MYQRIIRLSLLLAFACGLSACGFQLRGTGEGTTTIPDEWKSMFLRTGNPNSELSREVRARFAANGVLWQERDSASFTLVLSPERFQQKNLSLNSEARAAEFELTLSANFSVIDAKGNERMEKTTASVLKQIENDPRNVVGKAEEIRLVRGEMRTELAQQIMRRIGFFATSTQSPSP